MHKRGSRRGSALIMVMLVVAGITTIIFATQRIALVQFSQSVREEDNLTAYYAAQAGIEDGLVRYRFEKNTEVYKNSNDERVKFRFNLTDALFPKNPYEVSSDRDISEGVISSSDYDPKHQYYDLEMNYKTQLINIVPVTGDVDMGLVADTTIEKDQSLVLSGFPVASGTTGNYLRHVYDFENCSNDEAFVALQIIRSTNTNGSISRTSEQVIANKPAGQTRYDSAPLNENLVVSTSGTSSVSSVRIRPHHCDVSFAFAATNTVNGLIGDTNTYEFDGLFTEILSTGYFGSAKRTLIAQVDRQTGNLIGIFDYILYSGGNTGIDRRF